MKSNRLIDEALFHACSTAGREEVQSLLDRGANPNAPYYSPDATTTDARYCIHEAAMNKDAGVFDLLVE